MAQRKKVGLIFSSNESWIAGAYYILNLISALNTLEDEQKPEIYLYTKNNTFDETKEVKTLNYPYISYNQIIEGYYDYPVFKSIINKIAIRIFKREFFDVRPENLDICFPNVPQYHFAKIAQKCKISWIPDFQEDYFPGFFSKQELLFRKAYQLALSKEDKPLVFSSFDALADFRRLYPNHKNTTFVLQFAVTHPSYEQINIKELREKYNLSEKYFFAPNQFWGHKNQIIILKAVKKLKENGEDILVAFSGKQEDYRNPDYFESLQKYVIENNLKDNIRFLGFIDRKEQLQLMKNALAIIQPSLFEGWSTVVEDAKAMNAYLVCSDLRVHKEQCNKNITFFDPHNADELAEKLLITMENQPEIECFDYQDNIKEFGKVFLGIINTL